jgi:oxygen-independent coproporphyrinogen-3 oxidase
LAGIYIHIPFCKKACFYCDFHFSVSFKQKNEIVNTISQEIEIRKDFIDEGEVLESIYFGGGTPSVLTEKEIAKLLDKVKTSFLVSENVEVTFECNPDDLSLEYLKDLKDAGINRLSIGIQSFNDEHLKWMNRSHSNDQSTIAIQNAAEVGFTDITIDLIYGLAQLSIEEWEQTIDNALALPINHLSAYSLTLEENTPYNKLVNQKKYEKPNDDLASEHFALLINKIEAKGWNHYEVSNFCKDENYSRHNTSYWQNIKYLGIGPSAHSFDGVNRYWNVNNNTQYLELISSKGNAYEMEELSKRDRLNETILTGLRTKWGINLAQIKDDFGYDIKILFADDLKQWLAQSWVEEWDDRLKLNAEGFLFADYIASELFLLKE